ncbi:MAG: toll/interleukin-1 receptor domain-containing protein [Ruminococcaceae bacterium]|nr:toll/interleukin-1 receptor domain-containing protein [Oscillospiraceae bacterium]
MDRDYEAFISYRHKECNPLAKALHDELSDVYAINSFRDDEGLHFGDFREQLVKNNKKSKYLILLLTPETLDRCVRHGDWITKEVSLFLERKKPIIPVKLAGFEFPQELPEAIKGLRDHDCRSIRCDISDPSEAARYIARQVQERLRKGWKPRDVADCISKKPFLSKENLTRSGYFCTSANKLRNSAFYLLPVLAMAIIYRILCFRNVGGATVFDDKWGFLSVIFGILSLLFFFLEHKKVDDDETGERIPFSIHWMDRSELGALAKVWVLLFILSVVFALAVTVVSFGAIIASVFVGQAVLGIEQGVKDTENMWFLCAYAAFVVIPAARLIIKTILDLCHFLNSTVSRYPARYVHWKRITLIQKIWRIVGWIILVPAIAVVGALLLGLEVV